VAWGIVGATPGGSLVQSTGTTNTTGVVQLTIDDFYGCPVALMYGAAGGTIQAPSYINIRNATLTAAITAESPMTNVWSFAREAGSSYTRASLAGTTAGTALSNFDEYSSNDKRFKVYLNRYENKTVNPQSISFLYGFTETPAIVHDDSGGAIAGTGALQLPHSMSSAKTGWIILEGY
jgi:hypothetical protein